MAAALFGKLPVKRDFLAINLPRDVLTALETWLQVGMATSRESLGPRWRDLYLVAPIWRFFIGGKIVGVPIVGALMPSVDGVGRYFPLLILDIGEPGTCIDPPTVDPREAWFAEVEARLLHGLGESFSDHPEALLAGLGAPGRDAAALVANGAAAYFGAEDGATLLEGARAAEARLAAATRSLFWTAGSPHAPPRLHGRFGLPEPGFFASLVDGEDPVAPTDPGATP